MRLRPSGRHVLERAHVVQPVGELDQQHAHVVGDGEQELAQVLGLLGLARDEIERFSLVRPSTRWPMSGPKIWSISARVVGVSSIVSCSSAAAIVASSSLRSVRMAATSSGWEKYGSPEARFCSPCAFMA